MFCRKCGNEMYDEDRYCLRCGFDNQSINTQQTQQPINRPKKKKGCLIPMIIMFVIIILLFRGCANLFSLDEVKPETTIEEYETIERFNPENIVGISDKDIKSIDTYFSVSPVRNDITGNWKISTIAENINIEEYAKSYYKRYFSNDNEIHAIVNFYRKTTTRISRQGPILNVSILEYVEKEEHDANILFSGLPLVDYIIYLDNGDIEKIKE